MSEPTPPDPLGCDEALQFFCDDARKEGEMHCIQCTGMYSLRPEMLRAHCSDATQMCVPDRVVHTCREFANCSSPIKLDSNVTTAC